MEYQNPLPRLLKNPLRISGALRVVLEWYRMYFRTQTELADASYTVVETPADARILPDDRQVYPYLFACVYVSFAIWFMLDRLGARRFKRGLASVRQLMADSRKSFVARPTRMRDRERGDHPLLSYTQEVDGPTNCYPSMHVGLTALAYQFLKDSDALSPSLRRAMRRSCIDICRSTLFTKQHSIVDVIGGLRVSSRCYEAEFEGGAEDLLDEVLPELSDDERRVVRSLLASDTRLEDLLDPLLDCFGGSLPHPDAE